MTRQGQRNQNVDYVFPNVDFIKLFIFWGYKSITSLY